MSEPPERRRTLREALRECLEDGAPWTLLDLSRALGVSERDLPDHLEHLRRTLRREGRRLVIDPATCLQCGFVFEDRKRFDRPGRCPECRQSHLAAPAVRLEG